ncbi:MAG TPA: SDR family oxidoreductase [Bacteroidales bacterium]|nr:SDR family oxidoreductase [Bacteroidales bacterium]
MQHYYQEDFSDKVVLITGAARGIGRECALAFAEAGADIVLGLRDIRSDAGITDEIKAMGRKVLPLQMDVSNTAEVKEGIETLRKEFGKLDILVNNAGIGPPNPVEKVTEEDFDYTVNVNLKGTFFVSQQAGLLMVKQKYGRIVNLSSQAGFIALPTESVYCMTKAAIAHLTKCFAVEWGRYNITVNAVAPTFIKTPGTEQWLNDEEFKKEILSKVVLGRVGIPKDVTSAIMFLSSEASSLITGTTLLIDGGWTAQ